MLDCSLNMSKSVLHFMPQMLVPNPRIESMPNFRMPNGQSLEFIKEFNNRTYVNAPIEFSTPQFDMINGKISFSFWIKIFESYLIQIVLFSGRPWRRAHKQLQLDARTPLSDPHEGFQSDCLLHRTHHAPRANTNGRFSLNGRYYSIYYFIFTFYFVAYYF